MTTWQGGGEENIPVFSRSSESNSHLLQDNSLSHMRIHLII